MSEERWKVIEDIVVRIDGRTETHTEKLDRIQKSIDSHLQNIAEHTASLPTISETLVEQKNENSYLVSIIASRPQVPLVVFLVVVGILGAVIVMDKAFNTNTSLSISPNKVNIGPIETNP